MKYIFDSKGVGRIICSTILLMHLNTIAFAIGGRIRKCIDDKLYEKRMTLKNKYAKEIGNDYIGKRELADRINIEIERINLEYYKFMKLLIDSQDKQKIIENCFSQIKKDPIALRILILIKYLSESRASFDELVEICPETREEFAALVVQDEILHSGRKNIKNEKIPTIYQPYGPVVKYFDKITILAKNGNRKALFKIFNLLTISDGIYAEYIFDIVKNIIMNNPKDILNNWSEIREYRKYIQILISDFYSKEEVELLNKKYNRCLVDYKEECQEILKIINNP